MKKFSIMALAMAALLSFAACVQTKEYTVRMITDTAKGSYYFEPSELVIKSGDTVTWVNDQDDTHNVMTESVPKGAEDFESPMLEKKGQKWSHVFTTSGTYTYHCHPHAGNNMRGMIIVDHPSNPGETQKNDAHDHEHHEEAKAASTQLTPEQASALLQSGKPVYSCPMHAHVFSSTEGRCPICGMDLKPVKEITNGEAVLEGSGSPGVPANMDIMEKK